MANQPVQKSEKSPNPLETTDFGDEHVSPQRLSKTSAVTPKLGILVGFLLIAGVVSFVVIKQPFQSLLSQNKETEKVNPTTLAQLPKAEVKTFTSKEDMVSYLNNANTQSSFAGGGIVSRQMAIPAAGSFGISEAAPQAMMKSSEVAYDTGSAERISGTNVQVVGIDEPDIVKTDGKQIYFSSDLARIKPLIKRTSGSSVRPEPALMPEPVGYGATKIISAFPPAALKQNSQIGISGNLLLDGSTLIVLGNNNTIYGYDVTSADDPKKLWSTELAENNYLQTARQAGGKLFLITRTYINRNEPCPYKPFRAVDTFVINCTSIYHPVPTTTVDSTYTVMLLDPKTGAIEKSTAFVGATNNSVVYMSNDNLFVTYSYTGDFLNFISAFFNTEGKELLPETYLARLNKLNTYDISSSAKMTEVEVIYGEFLNSLSPDDQMKFQTELNNRMEEYTKAHIRELEKTGIVKIDTKGLKVVANGEVSGHPLNQFSLDEWEDNLRIATTSQNNFWGFGINSRESINDVYVLDNNLKQLGAVKDLGLSERIYSARFIEDKGYLVTFKQTDPFYVLDLSNPRNPIMKGELKIPGFSSYLHPLAKNTILGVGMDEGKVKLSLFDVSNASDPKEVNKYAIDEYWTEVSSNHHAFLQDDKHQVFFMPGGKGGYIFSYQNNTLKLQKAISDYQIKRALYLNDYMYVVGENEISVFNEKDWTEVNHLELGLNDPVIEKPMPAPDAPIVQPMKTQIME